MQRGDEPLDVALALVPRSLQGVAVVRLRQMRRQEPDRGQRQRAVVQAFEDRRKPPRGPSSLDPVVGAALLEVQHLRAVGEERRAALAQVQAA
jgi:hypothetical protein